MTKSIVNIDVTVISEGACVLETSENSVKYGNVFANHHHYI